MALEVQQKILDQLKGSWPSAECTRLYEEAAEKYDNLQEIAHAQKAFLTGNGPDQSVTLKAAMREFDGNVRLLFTTVIATQESLSPGNASDNEVIPEVQNGEGVLTAKEFEDFKQRIHRRKKHIDTTLRILEPLITPEHRHYLDELIAERKVITDIVVEGLEGAKSQDPAAPKVYNAALVTRAEPHFSSINDIMRALDDLYSPKVAPADDGAAGKEENKTEVVLTELRVLSPAEEMKLLEAFFMRRMNGSDEAEKMAQVRRGLRELPLEEWREALQQARGEYSSDEELEQLLGPVVSSTPVSPGVAAAVAAAVMPGVPPQPAAPKAPEQAPAAAPEKTFTPEQQATRDKWLAARRKVLYIDPETLERQREAAAQERYKDMTTEEMLEILSEAQRQQILGDYMLDLIGGDGTKGGNPRMRELYVSATDDEKQALLRTRDQVIVDSSEAEMEYILGLRLSRLTVEERTKLFQNELISETEVPLQSQYQNKLTEYYEGFKTEGSGLQRFGKRIAATFGFKPELPPELDATREAMFDATAEYTKETREMLRLRKEAGKTAGEKLSRRYSESRQKQLLEEYVLEKSGTYDPAGNFTSLKFLYDQASTDEERAIILAKRDEDLAKLTDEQKDGLLQQKTEALIQQRYEKMLGRSVLMGTFERQLEAQRQVTEDLAFHAPEVLKKHKRKISLFAAGAIGGITGGASSAVMGVTRALAGGLLGASIGGFVGEKWKNRIERETEKGTGAVLDSLAQRLSKDSITASELEDTYQELKKIYEKADSQTRTRIAGLMAMALAIGLATGQAFEFGAESMGLVDTPDVGGSAEVTGSGEVPAGGVTDSIPDTAQDGAGGTEGGEAAAGEKLGAVASDGTTSPEAGQAVGGGTEGNAPAAETLKPYIAERGDNMWDILEGQTDAEKLPFMGQVDPDKLQGLLKEVELRLDADPTLRTEIGFGESSHDLSEGATVNVDRLNEVALKIAEEKGMLADANVAEAAAAADASPDAMPTDSVETAAADAAPEQPTPTTEAAVEDAIANAEAAADKAADAAGAIKEVTAPDGTTFSYPYEAGSNQDGAAGIESASLENEGPLDTAAAKVASDSNSTTPAEQGTRVEGLVGAEKVNAYATAYDGGPFDRGPLAFENQLVKPYLGSVEGTPDNGFFGLFKQPPPPSMGGYALFQHVPLREMAELNSLPDDQLFSTLAEKYHAENPEQFSVWVEKLNDMQGRDVFNLNQTPDLTLADAVALDVINSKTTIV